MKIRWLSLLVIVCLGCSTDTTQPVDSDDGDDAATETNVELPSDASSEAMDVQGKVVVESADMVAVKESDSTEVDEVVQVEEEEEPELFKVGDVAPSIKISQWVTGEPVDALESGRLYVVEFWATWCGPCLMSMPHMSSLQETYRDEITFIGVTDENEETVTKFLNKASAQDSSKTWSEIITYRLAIDEDDATRNAFLRASGARGIPTAYIVGRQGKLLWTGHPMQMDGPIEAIASGDWNDDNAIAKSEAYQATMDAFRDKMRQASMAQQNSDWDEALAVLDSIKNDETLAGLAGDLRRHRLSLFLSAKKKDQALELIRELESEMWDDAQQLNGMAWTLVTELPDDDSVKELAMKHVLRAMELSKESEPPVLDTLARVHFVMGDLDAAIEWQRKAVDLLDDAAREKEPSYQERLDEYEAEESTDDAAAP